MFHFCRSNKGDALIMKCLTKFLSATHRRICAVMRGRLNWFHNPDHMTRIILFILVFSSLVSFAQNGHKIDFKIQGWKDTTVYLGRYQGETTVITDTAEVNSVGAFTFR